MITIGLVDRADPPISGSIPAVSDSGPRRPAAVKLVAGIRAFFEAFARWEAHMLWAEPADLRDRFSRAEPQALGSTQAYQLSVNRAAAEARRHPYRPSWLFARLDELAGNQDVEVQVWFVNYGPRSGFLGQTTGLPPRIFVFIAAYMDGIDLGETFCHEVGIHAWRKVRWGNTRNVASGGHMDDFHVRDTIRRYTPHHSVADAEGDLLAIIREGRPMLRPVPVELQTREGRRIWQSVQRAHTRYSWRIHDSIVAAGQGVRSLQADIPGLSPDDEYRLWRMYSPSRVGTSLRATRPTGP